MFDLLLGLNLFRITFPGYSDRTASKICCMFFFINDLFIEQSSSKIVGLYPFMINTFEKSDKLDRVISVTIPLNRKSNETFSSKDSKDIESVFPQTFLCESRKN